MFWVGLAVVVGAVFGLTGKARWFITLFTGITTLVGGLWLYDYYAVVIPNMEQAGSDDGTIIGFAFASALLLVTWLATLLAFCFGLMINTFLRLMDWL